MALSSQGVHVKSPSHKKHAWGRWPGRCFSTTGTSSFANALDPVCQWWLHDHGNGMRDSKSYFHIVLGLRPGRQVK